MKNERERHQHKSFGQISFSRVSCNPPQKFYGSELDQSHYIQLTISGSEVDRTLTKEWYYATKILARLRMSSGQFAELITSLNNGSGTPCTIEYIGDEKIDYMPLQESRKEFVHKKFKERMSHFADTIRKKKDESKELVSKKSLSKEDMRQLQNHLEWLTIEVERNIPFFAECFQETMDEVVHEAKTEIENAIQHKISVLGLAALHEQNKLLENMEITKEIVKYTSYKAGEYEAKVYDDKKIIIVAPPMKIEFLLQDLPDYRKDEVQPLIDFIEKDLGHNFTIAENEIED